MIADIEIGSNKISSASEIADAFNFHFANVGHNLARVIPRVNTQPEHSFIPTDKTFFIPAVAKFFERIIYNQFYSYLNDNDLLANCQSGLRSLHSTVTPCSRPPTVGLLK